MSFEVPSRPAARTGFGVRLIKRLERSDPFLMRAIQGAAVIGCVLGILIYAWQAIANDTTRSRTALTQAAAAGQVAAEAEVARINAAGMAAAPMIALALSEGRPANEIRSIRSEISAGLAGTPVTAIIAFNDTGDVLSVFGQLPSDSNAALAPMSNGRRAGGELVGLELVRIAPGRAAYYRDLPLGNSKHIGVAMVLRASAFQSSLQVGAAAGDGWRAALLNRDGEPVLTASAKHAVFSDADNALVATALGWRPLHGDEVPARDRTTGQDGDAFVETRTVAADMAQLAYVGKVRPAFSVLASRRFEFIALFGASMMAVLLAVSIIQNEWQRQDRQVRDADMTAARAEITCDLLAAGVIDWSVADGSVEYSEGWAELFAQGGEPVAEQIFDWIARIHPDDQLAAREAYQQMLEGKSSELVHRIRIRMSSGLWVQVVERGRALFGPDGRTKRIVLVQTTEPVDGSALRNAFGGAALPDSRTA
jgi:PAS domain-containing protein